MKQIKEEQLKTCRDLMTAIDRLSELEPRANNNCGAGYSLTFAAIAKLANLGTETANAIK